MKSTFLAILDEAFEDQFDPMSPDERESVKTEQRKEMERLLAKYDELPQDSDMKDVDDLRFVMNDLLWDHVRSLEAKEMMDLLMNFNIIPSEDELTHQIVNRLSMDTSYVQAFMDAPTGSQAEAVIELMTE